VTGNALDALMSNARALSVNPPCAISCAAVTVEDIVVHELGIGCAASITTSEMVLVNPDTIMVGICTHWLAAVLANDGPTSEKDSPLKV
jgi:hypothetical protein